MQQTKSYWRIGTVTAIAGVVAAFVGSACTVTSGSDDGGAAGSLIAGAPSAGANTAAGAGGASAGAAAAGAAGTATAGAGGAAPVPYECTPAGGDVLGTPNTCAPAAGSETDKCALCVQSKCCTEYSNCYATSPGNQCGWGGPNDEGEIACIQKCIQDKYQETLVYDEELLRTCTNGDCATNKANHSTKECMQIVGQQTSDLVACLDQNCQGPCFTGEPQ